MTSIAALKQEPTDHELLEKAAKAAGMKHVWIGWMESPQMRVSSDGIAWSNWNPLTDDGDALRLAVARKILRCHMDLFHQFYEDEIAQGLSEAEATRRAFVRAAALGSPQ